MSHPLNIDLSDFPIRENLTYINHAGTAPITRPAAKAMKKFADECSNYASAIYHEWTMRLDATRGYCSQLLGCSTDEVAFAKSTTLGLHIVAEGIDWKPGDVVIAEERTFPANWIAWRDIAQGRGAEMRIWPERDGFTYELEDLENLLKQGRVRLVAATTANFGSGFRQDMEALGKLCKQYDALLCVDAIQTLGVFPLDVKKCRIDFLAADSHKWLLGPEGAALFYCAHERMKDLSRAPIGWMGRHNFTQFDRLDHPPDPTARRFEEGAPNIAGWTAMGESMRLMLGVGIDNIARHNLSLCAFLREGLQELGWEIGTPADPARHASIVASHRKGTNASEIVPKLWDTGRVWAAARRDMLRLSPHFYQTEDDMRHVLATLRKVQG